MDIHGNVSEIPSLHGIIHEAPTLSGVVSGAYILDYDTAKNKPRIESIELKGDKSLEDIGIGKTTNAELALILV